MPVSAREALLRCADDEADVWVYEQLRDKGSVLQATAAAQGGTAA